MGTGPGVHAVEIPYRIRRHPPIRKERASPERNAKGRDQVVFGAKAKAVFLKNVDYAKERGRCWPGGAGGRMV